MHRRLEEAHALPTPERNRLEHGRLLIEQTAMSILEISIASGFSSRRDFTRAYRNAFGFPPAGTRRTP